MVKDAPEQKRAAASQRLLQLRTAAKHAREEASGCVANSRDWLRARSAAQMFEAQADEMEAEHENEEGRAAHRR